MNKSRLTEITDAAELTALHAASIDAPRLFSNRVGSHIHFWADADELRAWRMARDKAIWTDVAECDAGFPNTSGGAE